MELRHNLATVFFSVLLGVVIAVYRNQRLLRDGQIKTLRVSPLVLGTLLTLPFGVIIYYTSAVWWLLRAELFAIAVIVGASIVHTPRGRVVSFFGGRFDLLSSTDTRFSRVPFEARSIVISGAPNATFNIEHIVELGDDERLRVVISGTVKRRNGSTKPLDDAALTVLGQTLYEQLQYATEVSELEEGLAEYRDDLREQLVEAIHRNPLFAVDEPRLRVEYIEADEGDL